MREIGASLDRLQPLLDAVIGGEDGRKRRGRVNRERDRRLLEPMLDALDGNHAAQNVHRVRVLGHGRERRHGRGGERARAGQLEGQGIELSAGRQAPVPQEVSHLLEGHVLGEVRDDVSAIDEAAVGAVDE